jgi:hypothetical protein
LIIPISKDYIERKQNFEAELAKSNFISLEEYLVNQLVKKISLE